MALSESSGQRLKVGQELTVDIEKVAHGGHFIARHEGQVIFVRHAIPGERAIVSITGVNSKIARADAISILRPSEFRTVAPCRFARPGGCGGCDFQHIDLAHQRELKSQVVIEQFARLAGLQVSCPIEGVEPGDGLHWRSRMDFAVGPQGHIGLFAHQSNQVVEIDDCLISKGEMDIPHLAKKKWNGRDRVEVAASSTGEVNLSRAGRSLSGPSQLTEKVNLGEGKELRYTISPQSFWQSHVNAPKALATKVLQLLQPTEGEVICDLYGGVGLFALALASEVGETGKVHLVESSKVAIADATRIFKSEKSVHIHSGMVESVLPRLKDIDAILLDPPRTGAGEQVVRAMAQANPRVIVYVSCDPASLARDAKSLALQGYRLESLTGFDLFPHTHHVECVARFIPA